jgi:hypothetical protein
MKKQGHYLDIFSSGRHGCDVLKKTKFSHRLEKFKRKETKETKERTDGREFQIGKGCTGACELYNTKNGKNDFYHR